jgi:hypothetical protein
MVTILVRLFVLLVVNEGRKATVGFGNGILTSGDLNFNWFAVTVFTGDSIVKYCFRDISGEPPRALAHDKSNPVSRFANRNVFSS